MSCVCKSCGCSNPCDCGEIYCPECLVIKLEQNKERERIADSENRD